MKKNRNQWTDLWFVLKKPLSMMKWSLFLFILSIFQANAFSGYAQRTQLSLDFRGTSIETILNEIENQSDYYFLYNKNMVDVMRKVDIDVKDQSIGDVLNRLFGNSNITYRIFNRQVVLSNGEKPLENISSQIKTITGKVTDSSGASLPGVTVVLKGTTQGTITDASGNYTILNVPGDAVVVFSFVGMKTQEINVDGKSMIDVVLEEDAIGLDEVVAIGYGVTKKSDLTGSVSSIAVDDISRHPVLSVGESLRGKATGIQITQQNAAPGAGIKMRIRGANSVNGSNDPLYVIDGFVGGDINSLNVSDIGSVSILKDASATALYGSRGSNGVVLVTTKQAKEGENKIEYNGFLSFDRATKTLDVLNATQFMTVANESQAAVGNSPFFTNDEIATAGEGVNWQNEILRSAITQNHQLSFIGSKNDTKYYLSGTYQDQQGIVLNSFYKRYGFKSNLNSKLRNNLDVAMNINGTYSQARNNSAYDGRNSPMGTALVFPACVPIKDENGEYNISPASYGPVAGNPVFGTYDGTDGGSNTYAMNILGDLRIDWTIFKNLKLSISGGANLISSKTTGQSIPTKDQDVTTAISKVSDGMAVNYQNTNQLSYSKEFGDHKIDAIAVYEQQKYVYRGAFIEATGFPTIALGVNALQLASTQQASSSYTQWSLQSYLGRINYLYQGKYMATVSARIDGSSKFADGNKYGYFPSGALAWRLSEEDFIKSTGIFQNLKLRASYGVVGSQAISPYSTLQQLEFGTTQGNNYQFDNATSSVSISPSTPANEDLKWESTSQWNLGLDVGVFEGRLSGTIDYYYKKTTDLLMNVSVPDYVYGGTQLQNVGSLENKGLEFSLHGILLDTRDWYISTDANISFNRNKILHLGQDDEDVFVSSRQNSTSYTSYCVLQKGKPLGQMYGLTYLGTWKSSEETEAAKYGNIPGDSKYTDVNGDYTIDGEDMDVIGQGLPDYTWSWNVGVSYRNFDLNFLFNGVHGNNVWNFTRFLNEAQNSDVKIPTSTANLNRWSTSNESSDIPNFSSSNVNQKQSSRWIEDGSYLRLSNVTLGYRFSNLLKNTFVRNAKVYFSGQNLFTITNYSGYNPEASGLNASQDRAIGYDSAGYPALRSYILGFQFSF